MQFFNSPFKEFSKFKRAHLSLLLWSPSVSITCSSQCNHFRKSANRSKPFSGYRKLIILQKSIVSREILRIVASYEYGDNK